MDARTSERRGTEKKLLYNNSTDNNKLEKIDMKKENQKFGL